MEDLKSIEPGDLVFGKFAQAERVAMVAECTSRTAWVVYWVPSNEQFQAQKVSAKRIDHKRTAEPLPANSRRMAHLTLITAQREVALTQIQAQKGLATHKRDRANRWRRGWYTSTSGSPEERAQRLEVQAVQHDALVEKLRAKYAAVLA